jgi:hypothetical protein
MGQLPRSLIGEHRRVERVGGIALTDLHVFIDCTSRSNLVHAGP